MAATTVKTSMVASVAERYSTGRFSSLEPIWNTSMSMWLFCSADEADATQTAESSVRMFTYCRRGFRESTFTRSCEGGGRVGRGPAT